MGCLAAALVRFLRTLRGQKTVRTARVIYCALQFKRADLEEEREHLRSIAKEQDKVTYNKNSICIVSEQHMCHDKIILLEEGTHISLVKFRFVLLTES